MDAQKYATVNKQVTIGCKQMFHITENRVITVSTDGDNAERYVIQGFTRPVAQTGAMQIQAVSVNDYPLVTIIKEENLNV